MTLEPKDFRTSDCEARFSSKKVDLVSFRAYYDKCEKLIGSKNWAGQQPVFRKLYWQIR